MKMQTMVKGFEKLASFGKQAATPSANITESSTDVTTGPVAQFRGLMTIFQNDNSIPPSTKIQDSQNQQNPVCELKGVMTIYQNDNGIPISIKPRISPNHQNVLQRPHRFAQKNLLIIVSLLGILNLCFLIWLSVTVLKRSPGETMRPNSNFQENELSKTTPRDAPAVNETLTLSGKLKLVSRREWMAQPPVQPGRPLQIPAPYVIILHTDTENCSSQAQCIFHVRFLQTFYIQSLNWGDIGYNFLVGGDGEAYEGRGWTFEGAHTSGYTAKSIGIAFIGTFNDFKPPDKQILAAKRLIAMGVEMGYIKKDYKLLAHRQLQTTESPGAALYEDMKKWDHWAEAL